MGACTTRSSSPTTRSTGLEWRSIACCRSSSDRVRLEGSGALHGAPTIPRDLCAPTGRACAGRLARRIHGARTPKASVRLRRTRAAHRHQNDGDSPREAPPGVRDQSEAALEKHPDLQSKSVEELCRSISSVPEDIRTPVRNNGGGHWNHSKFWTWMAPNAGGPPSGKIADAINGSFGSFDAFKEQFAKAGVGRFGSGWAWVIKDGTKLAI